MPVQPTSRERVAFLARRVLGPFAVLLLLGLRPADGRASAGATAGAQDLGLARLLDSKGRKPRHVLDQALGAPGSGVRRVVVLARQWGQPALLAAELDDGRWVDTPLPRGTTGVDSIEIRDLAAGPDPEIVLRVRETKTRVDQELRLVRLLIYRFRPLGQLRKVAGARPADRAPRGVARSFDAEPIFDLVERAEERSLSDGRGFPSARLQFKVELRARPERSDHEIWVALERDAIDSEHPALASASGQPRKPASFVGRYQFTGAGFTRVTR